MDFVDEKENVAASADLFQHLLEPLLEVTPVARPGDQRPQVEGVDLFPVQRLRDFAGDDPLGKTLDDRGLANPRLTDQHGIVLGSPRQNLHDPFYLPQSTNHRIELAVASHLGEVATELVEHRRSGGTALATTRAGGLLFRRCSRKQLNNRLPHLGKVGAQLLKNLSGYPFAFPDQAEQDVFGADVVVTELEGFSQAQLENLFGPGSERYVSAG